jgi:uncharacterized membrane protein YkgB
MVIDAVILFSFLSAALEFVLLMKTPPRYRLRLLGSSVAVGIVHTVVGITNLIVHFGTLIGSMSAVVSALASFATIPFARWLCGTIKKGRYHKGVLSYDVKQLT